MTRLRVRDVETLRKCMDSSRRVVPHSVRSLAALVGASRSTIGYLRTGERPVIEESLAQKIAVALGVSVDDLFVAEGYSFANENDGGNQ